MFAIDDELLALALSLAGEQEAIARAQPASAIIETNWRTWLKACAPNTFTAEFAPFHVEFWEWYWRIAQRRKVGVALDDDERVFLAVWGRGMGKSSNVEWAAIAEGALVGSGYVLYVSGTQALAEEHVAAIRERIESEAVARHYPHLSNPQIGKHGNQFGWRQDFLRTRGGWAIRPIGLDVGVRGGRTGDVRPTLIVLDDVDSHDDSPLMVKNKLETITRAIIPAGGPATIILTAQNLIHRNGVINQVVTRRTSALGHRIISGPHPALDGLQIEAQQTPTGLRNFIIAGRPTWAAFDLKACQKFLDDSGREAFLAEYQHDFSAIEEGRVLPEYDEAIHVITWSQFERVFGYRYIPQHWKRDCGLDIGYTPGHLSAWTWITTSSMNSKFPGLRFRYRGMTFSEPILDEMAEAVKRVMIIRPVGEAPFDEVPLIQRWRASHERKGERDTLRVKYDLPFLACRSGKTDGIPQWRHFLRADHTKPHPFNSDQRLGDGNWVLGCPGWFDIVDDNQLDEPRDDQGLMVHRRQAQDWKYAPERMTVLGLAETLPMKADEDSVDSTRMITAEWGPEETDYTAAEQQELELPKPYRLESISVLKGDRRDYAELMRAFTLSKQKREKQLVGDNWTHEIIAPEGDDPWKDYYQK